MKLFLTDWKQRSTVLAEAQKATFKPAVWMLVLIFIGLFIAGQIAGGIVIIPVGLPYMLQSGGGFENIDAIIRSNLWISLYATIPITAVFIFYMRFSESRSYASMGFVRGGIAKRYLWGLGAGLAMCLVALGIACATGGMRFGGFNEQMSWAMLLVYFVGFVFQGMSEEVVCRGFLMVSAANRAPLWIGIAINSMVFAVLHLANDGVTFLSFLNLILFGVFASFFFLRTDNVWGIGAMHSAWNFTMGNIVGVEVSGNVVRESVMHFGTTDAPDFLSGGRFGLEGGIATTIVYSIGILLLIFWPRKCKQ